MRKLVFKMDLNQQVPVNLSQSEDNLIQQFPVKLSQNEENLQQPNPITISQNEDILDLQFIDFAQLKQQAINQQLIQLIQSPIIQNLYTKLQKYGISQQISKNIQYLYDQQALRHREERIEKNDIIQEILKQQSNISIKYAKEDLELLTPNKDRIIQQLINENDQKQESEKIGLEDIQSYAQELYDEQMYQFNKDQESIQNAKERIQQCYQQRDIKSAQFCLFDQYYYQLIINYQEKISEIQFITKGYIKLKDKTKFCCQMQTVKPQYRYQIELPNRTTIYMMTDIVLFGCFHTNNRKSIANAGLKDFDAVQQKKAEDYDEIFNKWEYQELRIIKNLKETEIFQLLLQLNEKNFFIIYEQLAQIPIFMIASYFAIRVQFKSFVKTQTLLSDRIIVSRKYQQNNYGIQWNINILPQNELLETQRLKLIIKMEQLLFDTFRPQLIPYFDILKQQNSNYKTDFKDRKMIKEKEFLYYFEQGMKDQIKQNKVIILQQNHIPLHFIKRERECLIDICDIKKTYVQFNNLSTKTEQEQKKAIKAQMRNTAQQLILLIEKLVKNYNISNDALKEEKINGKSEKDIFEDLSRQEQKMQQNKQRMIHEIETELKKRDPRFRDICIKLQDSELTPEQSDKLYCQNLDKINAELQQMKGKWDINFDKQLLEKLKNKHLNQQHHWNDLGIELQHKIEFNNYTHQALLDIYRQIVKHYRLFENKSLICSLEIAEQRFVSFIQQFQQQKQAQFFDSESLQIFTQQVLNKQTEDFLFNLIQVPKVQNIQEEQKIEISQTQNSVKKSDPSVIKFNKEAAEKIKSLKCPHGYQNCKDIGCAKINCHCSVNNIGNNSLVPLCKQLVVFGECKKLQEGKCIYCHCINKNTIDLMDCITYRETDRENKTTTKQINKEKSIAYKKLQKKQITEQEYKCEIQQIIDHYRYSIIPIQLR